MQNNFPWQIKTLFFLINKNWFFDDLVCIDLKSNRPSQESVTSNEYNRIKESIRETMLEQRGDLLAKLKRSFWCIFCAMILGVGIVVSFNKATPALTPNKFWGIISIFFCSRHFGTPRCSRYDL